MKPHKHAEFIKAKADGQEVQEQIVGSVNWLDMQEGDWDFIDRYKYRIKPAAPKWPETMMSDEEMSSVFPSTLGDPSQRKVMRDGVNYAISRLYESGSVVTAEAADKIRKEAYADGVAAAIRHENKDRDMAVALAAQNSVLSCMNRGGYLESLTAIIAKVK